MTVTTPPASDPEEQRLREAWHAAKADLDDADDKPPALLAFRRADDELSTYLWNRVLADIAEDRRKHPKAKRNLPVQPNAEHTRHLP